MWWPVRAFAEPLYAWASVSAAVPYMVRLKFGVRSCTIRLAGSTSRILSCTALRLARSVAVTTPLLPKFCV